MQWQTTVMCPKDAAELPKRVLYHKDTNDMENKSDMAKTVAAAELVNKWFQMKKAEKSYHVQLIRSSEKSIFC